jgi:hypothetical protein
MALYRGYFDESFSDGSPRLMGVAGYIIKGSEAKTMSRKWRWKLKQYNLPFFHMVDCLHKSPPYDDSNMTDKDRDELARYFIGLIKQHVAHGFAVISNTKHYEQSVGLGDLGKPYALSVEQCAAQSCAWLASRKGNDTLKIDIEAGQSQGLVTTKLKSLQHSDGIGSKLRDFEFKKKDESVLLQAGDIFAYQAMKHLKDHLSRERPPRKDFLALVKDRHAITYMASFAGNVHMQVSDPGLNQREEQSRRRESVLDFMDLLGDTADTSSMASYEEKWGDRKSG